MKKRQVNRLAKQLMAAAVLFTQAVFLLAPTNYVSAQLGPLSINFSPTPPSIVSDTATFTVYTNYAEASVDFFVDGPQTLYYPPVDHPTGTNYHSFTWNTGSFPPGSYTIKAQGSRAGETPYVTAPVYLTSSTAAPAVPASISASQSTGQIYVAWAASTGATHYSLERSVNGGAFSLLYTPNSTSYTDTNLTSGSSYSYRVSACASGSGCSAASAPSSPVTYTADTALTPPTNFLATQNGSSIMLTWTNVSGASYYGLRRSIDGGTYQALSSNTTVNYYSDTAITPGSNYIYEAYACSTSGGCSLSPAVSNTVQANFSTSQIQPTASVLAPSNLAATVSGSTVTLTWMDNSDNESGFKIYRYQNNLWTDIGNVGGNIATKVESSVPAGTYKYKINAFMNDSSGPIYSPVSNETAFITVGTAETTASATSTVPTAAASSTTIYWIDFYQPPSFLSTSSKIFAYTNILADRVDFTVKNFSSFVGELQPNNATDSNYYYAFRWDLNNFSNNIYQLKVFGSKGSQYFNSQYISIQVLKPVTQIDLTKPTSTTTQSVATTTIIKQPATISLFAPTNGASLSGWIKLQANSYGPIRRAEIIKISNNLSSGLGSAILNSTNNFWEFGWDTTKVADGDYALQIFAWDEQNYKISGNTINIKIKNTLPATPMIAPKQETTAQIPNSSVQPTQNETIIQPGTETTPLPNEEKTSLPLIQNIEKILQAPAIQVDSRCQAVGINDILKCDNFLNADKTTDSKQIYANQVLPVECQNANIKNSVDCEMFIRSEYLTFECKQAGLISKASCRDYLQSRFGKPAACSGLSDLSCQKLISQIILADFVDQQIIDQANKEVSEISGKYLQLIQAEVAGGTTEVTIKEDTATLSKIDSSFNPKNIKNIESILPFAKSEKQLNLLILPSTEDAEKSKMLVGANVLIDSDADGLTDDIEERLGTDKMNADTDYDGYSDGIEVRSGHNPLGAGELKTELKPMERAIVNKVSLEQPKLSGETRVDILKVQRIINHQDSSSTASTTTKDQLKLQGRALPNDVVSLYIYSVMPIVVTVSTDENGNWTYDLDKSLVDGKHEAYVVINDEAGKVKAKSAPFSFFIKEAKAVSQNDFLGADFAVLDRTTEFTGWYIFGSLLLIVLVLGGYLLYQKTRENKITYSK